MGVIVMVSKEQYLGREGGREGGMGESLIN